MKKNQKGFTLIELLVVIALMLSILGIAIVSFINISNNKKKEAWEDVKIQIETAATEYFTANEYMFEDLTYKTFGYVSVGKLVEEDYLGKVINPINGKSVDKCTLVKVTKNGNKLTANYDGRVGDNKECNGNYIAYTAEPGGPTGSIVYRKVNGDETSTDPKTDGWFNINQLGEGKPLKVCIDAKTNGNGMITQAEIGSYDVELKNGEYCATIESDAKYSNILATLTNVSGKSWKQTFSIKKDTQKPIIKYIGLLVDSASTYNNIPVYDREYLGDAMVHVDVEDNFSGVAEVLRNKDKKTPDYGPNNENDNGNGRYAFKSGNGERTETFNAKDNAGNHAEEILGSYIMSSKPSCPSFEVKSEAISNGSNVFGGGINVFVKLKNKSDKLHVMLWKNNSIQNGGEDVTIKNEESGFLDYYDFNSDIEGKVEIQYKFTGWVENKYGLRTNADKCVSDVYTIDKKPPTCPYMQYYFYKNSKDTYSDSSGSCKNSNNNYNITDSNKVGAFAPLSCTVNTKVAIEIHPTSDTAELDWYTNNGDYRYENAYTFWSTNSYSNPLVKTITSSNVNSGNRNGYVVVRDTFGNEQKCHTPVFTIDTDNTPDDNPKENIRQAKAYRWEGASKDCSGDKTITFDKKGDKSCSTPNNPNCNHKGPYKKYKFTELECECKGGKSTSYRNITKSTHPDGYSYIFYKNSKEGRATCNETGRVSNKNVDQVCQHGANYIKENRFHGVKWNITSNVSNKYNWSGEGWYNSSGTAKENKDAFKNNKEACDWACGKLN